VTRPLVCRTDTAALAHNLAQVQSLAPNAPIWAVAKARAYGHGLSQALQGFSAAAGIAVLEIEEAAYLRTSGWEKPILLLEGLFRPQDLAVAAELRLDLAVHQPEQAQALFSAAAPAVAYLQSGARIWVKLNTGMNRLGFPTQGGLEPLRDLVDSLRQTLGVGRVGFMMHFAQAESPLASEEPFARFEWALERLGHGAGEPLSLANSAAVIHLPFARMGWLRPGIALYGASPFRYDRGHAPVFASLGLRPAQTLQTELIAIQHLQAGDGVGYGMRFRAPSPMRIGVAAVGYADGYPRTAPDGTPVLVDGRRCTVAGQVSMDLLTIDLTAAPEAQVGSRVELWGAGLAVDEVASHCGTVGYELLTAITPRVAREAVGIAAVGVGGGRG
jgi:alanine racemase